MFASCHASVCPSTLVTWQLARSDGARKWFTITSTQPSISGSPSWKLFVEWLWDEQVEKHFLLSEEFKQLMPSKSWWPLQLQLCPLLCEVVDTCTLLPPILVSPSLPSSPLSPLSSHCPIKDAPPLPLLPHQEVLFSFSHKPALFLLDHHRLPGHIKHQAPEPSFLYVLPWVQPFLTAREQHFLCHLSQSFCHSWQLGPLSFYHPWKPIHCQHWGFGIPMLNCRIIADSPPMDQLIHFIWQFLKPCDRRACADTLE